MDVSSSHHLGMLARAKQGTACGQVKLRKCVFCAMEPTNAAGVDVLARAKSSRWELFLKSTLVHVVRRVPTPE